MNQDTPFVDHYEVLQLSQNADSEMIERVYRLLAKRFHPDNTESGDEHRFRAVHDAFEVLSDPKRRAQFDIRYDQEKDVRWKVFQQDNALTDQERDRRIFHGLLSLLYAARRRDPDAGGLGELYIEEMLGVPREHLEFPIWYLRKRGYVETLETGELAITIDGIDSMGDDDMAVPNNRLLRRADDRVEASEPAVRAL